MKLRRKDQGNGSLANTSTTQQKSWRDRLPSIIAGVTVPAVLATLAIANPGVTISELDLNDGAVWITNSKELKVGRYNAPIRELNGGVVSNSTRFDVLQDEQDVLAVETATVSRIDPATMSYTAIAQVPGQSDVALNQGIAVVTDPTGRVWISTASDIDTISETAAVSLDLSDGAVSTVSEDGTVYSFDPGTGTVHVSVFSDGASNVVETQQLLDAQGLLVSENPDTHPAISLVGTTPVVIANDILYTPYTTIELGSFGNQPKLQANGTTRGEVIVASDTSLIAVDTTSGKARTLVAGVNGRPAQPVFHQGCLYAAWSAPENNYATLCGDAVNVSEPDAGTLSTLEDVNAASGLVFRVNRDQIVLNDVSSGRVWLQEDMPQSEDPNWDDVTAPDDKNDAENDSDDAQAEQSDTSQCETNDRAPRAKDDEFGVRTDRTTILQVLTNDSVGQCGIIAITEIEQIKRSVGEVQLIDNGRALQVDVMPSATGTVSFDYTITDGRGQNPPSTATVTLKVTNDLTNNAPEKIRDTHFEVEQGATISNNALANFSDPDGDQLVLTNAKLEDGTGTLRHRKNGMVTYVADAEFLGTERATLTISDGEEEITETVEFAVRSVGTLAPVIKPIYRTAYVSSQIEVDILSSVKGRSTELVRLAGVDEVAGTDIGVDLDAGSFTFSAPTPGSYYVNFTVVSSPHTTSGLVRIDVKEIPADRLPPVAVSDVALLPNGGSETINPIANDFDPNGGVMVLTGVELNPDSVLSVGVIEHRFVKIESRVALKEPETIHYTIDNGYSTARGKILVQPVEPSTEQRAPTVRPIAVSVRAGGVVTIPVLDYTSDADGDEVSLVRELPAALTEAEGLLFASGNVLRYQAPNDARTTNTTFLVEDSAGNIAEGLLTVNVHESSADTKTPPKPKRITARAYAGETIRIPIPLTGIDQDGDGVILLGQGESLPTQGLISAVGADWLEYVAFSTARGTDTFTYAVEDWTGQRALGTIRVGIVEKPSTALPIVASDDNVTVQPGTTVAVRVTRNDVDPSGLALTVDPVPEIEGVRANVENNQIVVDVPDSAEGDFVIPYTVRNLAGGFGEAQLTVHVSTEAQILPPTVDDIVVSPFEVADKTSVEVDVFEVTENPSGTPRDLELTVPTSHSEVASVSSLGKITVALGLTPQTIPFRLTNPAAPETAYTYAFITVPALGDFAPMLRPKTPPLVTSSGKEIQIPLAQYVYVGSGKTATIRDASSVEAPDSDGSELIADSAGTTLRFVSRPDFHGTTAISFEVWDSKDASGKYSILTIPITVRPSEQLPPQFAPTKLQIPQGNEVIRVDLAQFTKPAAGMEDSSYGFSIAATPPFGMSATIEGTVLAVSAPANAVRGTSGEIALTLSHGVANNLKVTVPFEIVASSKQRPTLREQSITANAGETVNVSVLKGAIDPVGAGLKIIESNVLTSGTGTARINGSSVAVTPRDDFSGTMKVAFTVSDALDDPNRHVDGHIVVTVRDIPEAPNTPQPSEPGNRKVTLSWEAPVSNGAPIIDYRVTANPGGKTTICSGTTCEIEGLTNATAYRFTVAARNEVGYSPESALSSSITPDILPEAPSTPTTVYGDGEFDVAWNAPSNQGSAIERYILEISPGLGNEGVTERSITGTSTTIKGARNGTAYTVRVRAVNAAVAEGGRGPWSSLSQPVIPAGVPDAPAVTASLPSDTPLGRQIVVTWVPGAANGDPISSYQLVVVGGSSDGKAIKLSADGANKWTFTEAENGVDYSFQVSATNKAGASPQGTSGLISSFTAPSVPRARASELVPDRSYAKGGAVKYMWDAPMETGGTGIKISHYEFKGSDQKVSGTNFTKEDIVPGEHSGDLSVRACNTRNACSDWVTLQGLKAITKPQTPTVTASATSNYETYSFTVTPGKTGGTESATYEYRVNEGEWRNLPSNRTITGTVSDFGTANSKDVLVEARGSNSYGVGTPSGATMTVLRPQPPTAPTHVALTQDQSGDGLAGTWQPATSRGIAIDKYEYCLVTVGESRPCGTFDDNDLGRIFSVSAKDSLKTGNLRATVGAEYELHVWALGKNSGGGEVQGPTAKAQYMYLTPPSSE